MITVNILKDALRERATAAGLDLSAAVLDAVAMATAKFIRNKNSVQG
jgi:hypothetical protein